jgi:hypothetical protein
MYLGWFDDNPKKSSETKIDEAIAAYVDRFKHRPSVVLVSESDRNIVIKGIATQYESYIRRNNFWVGIAE